MTAFEGWDNFYVIVGSSAGALIGLQFVVMTLLADAPAVKDEAQAGNAFSTPNVVHFCVVLLLSALAAAPWHDFSVVAVLWGLVGFGGIVYALIVIHRMLMQTAYRPVFEDWLFHALLPLAAYILMAASACLACFFLRPALFILGAAVLLLLFLGIHNAWDAVVYHIFVRRRKEREANREQKP